MVMTPRGLFLCRTLSTAGLLPLLPTSRNGTHGFGWAEPLWNSYSCDPSIAVLQSVPAFLLSQASLGPRSSDEVAQPHASARSNQRFVNTFLCLNLFFAERHSYVHICGFNVMPLSRKRPTRCSLYPTCPPLVGCSGVLGVIRRFDSYPWQKGDHLGLEFLA